MPALRPLRAALLVLACSALTAIAQEATPPKPADPAKAKLTAAELKMEEAYKKDGRKALPAYLAELEKIIAEFPTSSEAVDALTTVAFESPDAEARALWTRLANSTVASEKARDRAKRQLLRLDFLGKPIDLKFTATDGRQVDLAALKGKVVLIDFWATWCGPCMRELPHLKEVVNRYKDQGLEIVGISLDSEKTKEKLGQVVAREQMFWPQYFDGKGWKNDLAVRFHINSIPAVWLVDRDGIVRDTVANLDLEARVQQWLKPAVAAR